MTKLHHLFIACAIVLCALAAQASVPAEINPRQQGPGVFDDRAMAERAITYAQLSAGIYDNTASIDGWQRRKDWQDLIGDAVADSNILIQGAAEVVKLMNMGFNAAVYEKNGQFALVFEGTTLTSPQDWANNVANFVAPSEYYYLGALVTEIAKSQYPNLTLTGHSLGGGLAQYAARRHGLPAITFNAAGLSHIGGLLGIWGEHGDRVVNIRLDGDPVPYSGAQIGTEYIYPPSGSGFPHLMAEVLDTLGDQAGQPARRGVNWARVSLGSSRVVGVVSGNTSHIGSASRGFINRSSPDTHGPNSAVAAGATDIAAGTFLGAAEFAETEWFMVLGSEGIHLAIGNSFGSITAPNGGEIASLNNAGVAEARIAKEFAIPRNVRVVSFQTLANFVTTEFPEFVGTRFNDSAYIRLTTTGGRELVFSAAELFRASVNESAFVGVRGLPRPLDGLNQPPGSGGQTGWRSALSQIRTQGGGRFTVEVGVTNVGDLLYPSAILLNGTRVR